MAELSDAMPVAREAEDRKLFDELVNRYHKQIYNVAYRMVGNHADVDDLTQDTFVKAFRFFSYYKRNMPFDNWLYRIMSNIHVDWLRRRH